MTQVIVVGSGSAGSVVARRLLDAGVNVQLLEAGPADTNPAIGDPNRVFELKGGAEDPLARRLRPLELPGQPRLVLRRGAASHAPLRGLRRRRERVPRHRRPVARHLALRGQPDPSGDLEAAQAAGFELNTDPNGAKPDGIQLTNLSIRDGQRETSFRAFLGPVRDHPGLEVLTDTRAVRLLLDGDRCTGVEVVRDGRLERLHADDEVVLCAGAVESPRLLTLSGLAGEDELKRLGIPSARTCPASGATCRTTCSSPSSSRRARRRRRP